jgi:DNA repair exonuclease SbcCD ATPase subunit
MLKIKNITTKNFMSIGAQTQAVQLDHGNLTLVLGNNVDLGGDGSRNGVGKTTIANALSYGLYGEAITNIKKDNLINKTNGKNMLVTVEFEMGKNKYRVERGRKPNTLKLLVNGTEHLDDDAQGDSRETQKEIEKIVGFSHEMFKHLVALNTYTEPFLNMRANDQRNMIEHLLGITDLSAKADVLKELVRETKDNIKEEEFRIGAIKESNKRIEKNIADLKLKSKAWQTSHDKKISELANNIQAMNEIDVEKEIEFHQINAAYDERTTTAKTLLKEKKTLEDSLVRAEQRLNGYLEDMESANDGTCPSCGQDTAHLDTHKNYLENLKQKIADEESHVSSSKEKISKIQKALDKLPDVDGPYDTFYSKIELAYEHKHNLEALCSSLEEKMAEENPYTEQIVSLQKTGLQELEFDTINELVTLKDHQEFLLKLLVNKDSFIRKRIIDQNLAYLNFRLAHYLEKVGLPHKVQFNNDLSVDIKEYGRDLDFANLSRGEMNRVILSLSFSFRDIYESLNHPLNIMIIDELVDNGLDSVGTESVIGLLKKMNRDYKKDILLISHKDELVGRVSNVLTVIKENGFTSFNTDTEYT